MTARSVGFAGLGIMGSRMAARFLDNHFPLWIWNRTPRATNALQQRGASVASTPEELARHCDVVFTCLADPAAVRRVWLGADGLVAGLRDGMRCVDTSTISPALARELDEACRSRGAAFLEAPVTGSKQGAQDGTLLLMTGGARELHDELEPLLRCLGKRALYMGPTGMAATTKLIGNSVISFMLEGLCEGLVLARRAGLRPEQILEVIQASGYASPYYAFKGGAIVRRDFETHFSIDLMHKDQRLALDEAAALKVPMPGLAAIHQVFSSARAHGLGDKDIAALIQAVERLADIA